MIAVSRIRGYSPVMASTRISLIVAPWRALTMVIILGTLFMGCAWDRRRNPENGQQMLEGIVFEDVNSNGVETNARRASHVSGSPTVETSS